MKKFLTYFCLYSQFSLVSIDGRGNKKYEYFDVLKIKLQNKLYFTDSLYTDGFEQYRRFDTIMIIQYSVVPIVVLFQRCSYFA